MKDIKPYNPRVLIISGSYPDLRCGVGDYVEKLIEDLMAKDVNVSLLTSCDPSIKREGYIHASIKKWNALSLFKVFFLIVRERPDLINLQVPTIRYKPILNSVSLMPLLSKIFLKAIPFVVTVHDYSISYDFLKIFFLPLFLFSDRIITTNYDDAEDIVRRFPFLKGRLAKIRMGHTIKIVTPSSDRIKEFYERVEYEKRDRFIATLGFIKKDRLVDKVIEIFDRLGRSDERLKLLILGEAQRDRDKKYSDFIFDLIKSSTLKDRIFWLGFCDVEATSFYLSITELGILLYERGASFRRSTLINFIVRKIPVVTNVNKRYGIDEELIGSGMVLTADSTSVDEIYEKAKHILYNENSADEMRHKMECARNIFDWQKHVEGFMNVYSELVDKG